MNPSELEKIKLLIQSSAILNPQERAEWMSLINVMSDKQLRELEKILATDNKANKFSIQQPSPQKPLLPNQDAQKPKQVIPALSHIVNLPSNFNSKPEPERKTVSPAAQIAAMKTNSTAAEPSSFASRLKNIFSEKELPAPAQSFPKAVQQPTPVVEKKPATATPPISPALPKNQSPAVKLVVPVPPKPKAAPPLNLKINADKIIIKPSPSTATLNKSATGAITNSAAQKNKPLANNPSPFKPGISFPQVSEAAVKQNIEAIKKDIVATKEFLGQGPNPTGSGGLILQNLDNLSELNVKTLKNYSLDSLVNQIKAKIQTAGYFDVIFNIEKSPAYKMYIDTGLKLLADQQDFEKSAGQPTPEDTLDRAQFEKFADLLTRIQSS